MKPLIIGAVFIGLGYLVVSGLSGADLSPDEPTPTRRAGTTRGRRRNPRRRRVLAGASR